MDFRSQVRGTPRALRETLEKGSREFEEVVRKTHWGDGPLFMVGNGSAYGAALTGACAFEELLGIPAIAVRPANFVNSTTHVLRQRSVVLFISGEAHDGELVEAVRQARTRGAAIFALANAATSPVAESADAVFLIRTEEEKGTGLQADLCAHAAMGFLGIVAARVLKRRHQKLDDLEREFQKLPEDVEFVQTRLWEVAKSLASELGNQPEIVFSGGGFYYPAAVMAADALASLAPVRARAMDAAEFFEGRDSLIRGQETAHILSGSRNRHRKRMAAIAGSVKSAGGKVYAVTDANDRELADSSSTAFLLPMLNELPGSVLALHFVHCLIVHISKCLVQHPPKH